MPYYSAWHEYLEQGSAAYTEAEARVRARLKALQRAIPVSRGEGPGRGHVRTIRVVLARLKARLGSGGSDAPGPKAFPRAQAFAGRQELAQRCRVIPQPPAVNEGV